MMQIFYFRVRATRFDNVEVLHKSFPVMAFLEKINLDAASRA